MLKIALVGAGEWGAKHLETLKRLGLLAAVVEPDEARRSALAAANPGLTLLGDCGQLGPQVAAAAVVAAPAALHARLATQLLEAGLHVLVEKPMALSGKEALALKDLASKKGLVLAVGHLLEHHGARKALGRLLAEDRLGDLVAMRFVRCKLGKVRTEENVLQSFAPHDLALALGLAGRLPTKATARALELVTPGIADTVQWGLEFPGGLFAQGSASWLEPAKEQKVVLSGRKGMALWVDTPGQRSLRWFPVKLAGLPGRPALQHGGPEEGELLPVDQTDPMETELSEFVRAITQGAPLPNDAAQGAAVAAILDAMTESMKRGGAPVTPVFGGLPAVRIHSTAEVHPSVPIGAGSAIWHFCHVMAGSSIGENASLGQNCFVAPGAHIGNGCRVQNNVSLYDGVILEDEVFVGPSAVFTNVKHPRCHVTRKDEYAKTIVHRRASLGANSTVVCGHDIGEYAFVAAGAVVASNVLPHALMAGCPARRIGWVCRCGEVLPRKGELACHRCGDRYQEQDGRLHLVSA
jgi:UDP-2-acetamido-3-amino-2,3-dideoxy-glucuronate N-acetyltransferase